MHRTRWAWFDHKNPDYARVIRERTKFYSYYLNAMSEQDRALLHAFYAHNPVTFINDWGVTTDPRLAAQGKPTTIPFILFPRQVEFIEWVMSLLNISESGVCDKSRDVGMSWVCVALAAHLAIYRRDVVIGFGSRKEEYVDRNDSPKSLFWKLRKFLMALPATMRGGFNERQDSAHMRIKIPDSNSYINGEAGDNIGRGDRTLITFIDESAFLMRPQLIDASMSATTNTRIDVSSVNGFDNPFAEKRHSWPQHKIFTFHWRDDPRKDDTWYQKQCEELSPVVVAQEIDLDYSASKEGVVIPSDWIQAATDLHQLLDIDWSGERRAGFDVADQGRDNNSLAVAEGNVLRQSIGWSGKGLTIYKSCVRVANRLDLAGCQKVRYDSDGLGNGVAGDAGQINRERLRNRRPVINFVAFHNGGEVVNKSKPVMLTATAKGDNNRTNGDFFLNAKAQAWWLLRLRFENAFRARQYLLGDTESYFDSSLIISLDRQSLGESYTRLVTQLSQVIYTTTAEGKLKIEKTPEGTVSPNDADAVMMCFAPEKKLATFFG